MNDNNGEVSTSEALQFMESGGNEPQGAPEPQTPASTPAPVEQTSVSGEPATPAVPEAKFTREDVAGILQGVVGKANGTGQAPQERTYTQEELNQMFNVFVPDEAFLAELGLSNESLPAVLKMRDALVKQANTYVEARLQQFEQALNGRFGPILQTNAKREAAEREARFFGEHTDLEPHKEAVNMVLAYLQQQGHRPKTPAEASKLLADTTRDFLKRSGVVLVAGDGASQSKTRPAVKMASLSGGGGGGAGRGTQSASSGGVASDLKSIFGP